MTRLTHGMWRTPEYAIWSRIIQRCKNPNASSYEYYGARGITIEWNSFEDFYKDMGPRPPGMTLDRRDNDKGYSKENCRWVTREVQQQNTRISKWWVIRGERYPSSGTAAKALGISRHRVRRLCSGRTQKGKFVPPMPGCYTEDRYE